VIRAFFIFVRETQVIDLCGAQTSGLCSFLSALSFRAVQTLPVRLGPRNLVSVRWRVTFGKVPRCARD